MNITKLQQKSVLQKLQNVAQNRNKVAQKSHKSRTNHFCATMILYLCYTI